MDIKKILKLITVEPVLFLYMMLIFLEMIGIKSIINTKVCLQLHGSDNCTNHTIVTGKDVVKTANLWNLYYDSILFSCSLIMSLYVASWSDYFGRKVIMMIPPIGTLIASILNATLSAFLDVHISYFFISAVISGLSFGSGGIITSTFGYLSDIVTEDSRTKRIVVLESCIFTGGTLGYYICGEILRHIDFNATFNVYAILFTLEGVLAAVTFIYVVFRIPFNLQSDDAIPSQNFSCRTLFSLAHLKNVKETVFKERSLGRRRTILLLIFALAIIYWGASVQMLLSFFYTEEKLHWKITEYSHLTSCQHILEGAGLLIVLPVIFRLSGISDYTIAIVGVVSRILGLIVLGLSDSSLLIYTSAVLFMFSECPVPAVRSMLSKLVDKDERGKIFAFTTIIQGICYFVGGILFPAIFNWTKDLFPGLSFEIVGALQIIPIIIFCTLYFQKETVTIYESLENEDGTVTETSTTVERELKYPS